MSRATPNEITVKYSGDQSPTDDPNLAQHIIGEIPSESTGAIGVGISRISTTQRVHEQHVISVHQEEDAHTEYELTSIVENSNHDSNSTIFTERDGAPASIPVGNEPHVTTEFCSDPKDVAYFLRPYPAFLGLAAGKSIWEKQTLLFTANPFMIVSVVAYVMAYLNLIILSCIHDRAKNSPHQHYSYGHYMIPKYTYYILCFFAHSVLAPIFIPLQ